jgi:hypothetical protein
VLDKMPRWLFSVLLCHIPKGILLFRFDMFVDQTGTQVGTLLICLCSLDSRTIYK